MNLSRRAVGAQDYDRVDDWRGQQKGNADGDGQALFIEAAHHGHDAAFADGKRHAHQPTGNGAQQRPPRQVAID